MKEEELTLEDIEYMKDISELGELGKIIMENYQLNPAEHVTCIKTKDNRMYLLRDPEGYSGELNITFKCSGYMSEEIDLAAEKLLNNNQTITSYGPADEVFANTNNTLKNACESLRKASASDMVAKATKLLKI